MTYREALELLEEASKLLGEIDHRASVIASARRGGKHGDKEIEFCIRIFLEKLDRTSKAFVPEQPFDDGFVLAPLPGEKRCQPPMLPMFPKSPSPTEVK